MKKHIMRSIVCFLSAILSLVFWQPAHAENYALLIAVDEYSGTGLPSLGGSLNDIQLMRQVLCSTLGFQERNITVLANEQASHQTILQAMAAYTPRLTPTDRLYIHYSGHGSQAPDMNGDEPDGMDSTLVPHGARRPESSGLNAFDILDDELDGALVALSNTGAHVVFVSDACHSGTITRTGLTVRSVPGDTREHPLARAPRPASAAHRAHIAVGATQDTQKALEIVSESGEKHGAFTLFWAKALQGGEVGETWFTASNRTKVYLESANVRQTPVFEGDSRVPLHASAAAALPHVLVTWIDSGAKNVGINAGSLFGITTGTILSAGVSSDSPIRLKVTAVQPTSCVAMIESGEVSVGSVVRVADWAPPDLRLPLAILADAVDGREESVATHVEVLASLVDADPVFRRVRSPEAAAMSLLVESSATSSEPVLTVVDRSGTPLPRFAPMVCTSEQTADLLHRLRNVADVQSLLRLSPPAAALSDSDSAIQMHYLLYAPTNRETWNSLPEAERLQVQSLERPYWRLSRRVPATAPEVILESSESLLAVEARNASDAPCHVYAVNLSREAVLSFLPDLGYQVSTQVRPGSTRQFADAALLEFVDAVEYVRLFYTRDPLQVAAFASGEVQNSARGAARQTAGATVYGQLRAAPTRNAKMQQWGTWLTRFVRQQ